MSTKDAKTAVKIAKWYGNKKSAVSLRFDDSCETHVKVAIPILNEYEMQATFMVNPGKKPYKKYTEFWESEVLKMGHQLGNHTWNHHGAKSLEKAEFEIGSVSRLIWKLQPEESKLLVFASGGGGKKWGGSHWRDAGHSYKQLMEKYHLIDLYDGLHPCIGADTTISVEEMLKAVTQAIAEQKHQPFLFHRIDRAATTIKGLARYIIRGYDVTFTKANYQSFIKGLAQMGKDIWVAPVLDILKYEEEYKTSKLDPIQSHPDAIEVDLDIHTNPDLYDHPLTLMVHDRPIDKVEQITKLGTNTIELLKSERRCYFNVKPVESRITIKFS